jgi:hypothetical protein
MLGQVAKAYQRFDDARPFVRPTYNQLEVSLLPPYGDPEVHIPGEVGTYVVAGLLANAIVELLFDE